MLLILLICNFLRKIFETFDKHPQKIVPRYLINVACHSLLIPCQSFIVLPKSQSKRLKEWKPSEAEKEPICISIVEFVDSSSSFFMISYFLHISNHFHSLDAVFCHGNLIAVFFIWTMRHERARRENKLVLIEE